MLKKILLALLFALTVFLAIRFFPNVSGASLGGVMARIATIPASLWLGLGALTFLFYLLDWLRLSTLLKVLGHRLRMVDGIRLTCVSYFVTSLTPSSELHLPSMTFMLSRLGIPAAQGLAASISKSIYMTLWICLVSCTTLSFARTIPLPAVLRLGLPLFILSLLGITLMLALIAFFPGPVLRWTGRHAGKLPDGSIRQKILLGVGASAQSISTIGKSTDLQHLASHLASIAFLLTYVVIGWLLAAHFGFTLTWLQALTIFSTSLMVGYLAPVPGAIGVTELATSYMLDPALTPDGMAVSLTLRILCAYLVTLPGIAVLVGEFRHAAGAWSLPRIFK